jgi:hydroxyethylthiazole kinase-like uncharacterized protein yjeF
LSPSWAVVTVEQMRALEASAAAAGITEGRLQANAASQIALVASEIAPSAASVVVLVGPGNNGRDAFLAGRLLARDGRRIVYYLTPRHAIAESELADLEAPGESCRQHAAEQDVEFLRTALAQAGVALDGLLGIGVRGPIRGPLDRLVRVLNEASADSGPLVISVDVPSGIDADTGAVAAEAVKADVTVALGAAKAGTLRFPAAAYVGRLEPRPIGLPEGSDADCRVRLLTSAEGALLVPSRPLDSHKGSFGWVMVLGGSREYVGAPILSAAAAARSGCGLVALAIPSNAQMAAASVLPEATYVLRDSGQAAAVETERLLARLRDFRSVVIGPGLGRGDESTGLVRGLFGELASVHDRPAAVLDADALYVLAGWADWWTRLPSGCVLTPHHGEMGRLTGVPASEIGGRAWEIATECAARWQQTIVLKGPHTVVAEPDGRAWVYPRANPGLASAGTGDVLAGLIGGLAAQGLSAPDAARLAVVAHALAAERLLETQGWRSLIASDLLPMLPEVLAELSP